MKAKDQQPEQNADFRDEILRQVRSTPADKFCEDRINMLAFFNSKPTDFQPANPDPEHKTQVDVSLVPQCLSCG